MERKFTYHYQKEFTGSPHEVCRIFCEHLHQEFDDFDEQNHPLCKRTGVLQGRTSQTVPYVISIVEFKMNHVIEIHSDNTQEVYITRYEFEPTPTGMRFHIYEKMESEQSRISMNYSIMSFFIRFGKKQKWRQMVAMIEQSLAQPKQACPI